MAQKAMRSHFSVTRSSNRDSVRGLLAASQKSDAPSCPWSVANARESLYADYKRALARGNNSTELTELADELASLSNQARAFIKVEP